MSVRRFVIIRTDSIGDVVLTLPLAGIIKENFPGCPVDFIGRNYTKSVVDRSQNVDQFYSLDEWSRQSEAEVVEWISSSRWDVAIFALPDKNLMRWFAMAKVPLRIATANRFHSWRYANRRVFFSRKKSDLHEAQLNLKLLQPLGIKSEFSLELLKGKMGYPESSLAPQKRIIFHPFSQGSALNWSFAEYDECIGYLPRNDWEIAISGTAKDNENLDLSKWTSGNRVVNYCGKFELMEFIDWIADSSVLVSCSTGPLHLAAISGIHAVGLYMNRRPIHPGRWSPLGEHVHLFVDEKAQHEKLEISPKEVAIFLKSIMERPTTKH